MQMPREDEFDSLSVGSGLKEDFIGVIRNAQFVKSDQGQNWNIQLFIDADDGEEVEARYGLGGDWSSYDGGVTIQHPKGERQKINNQTAYSGLIVSAVGSGAEDELKKRNRALNNFGYRHKDLWIGLSFHWDVVEVPGRTKVGDDWVDRMYQRMLPDKFVGESGVQNTLPQPAPVPTEASPAVSTPAPVATTQPATSSPAPHPAMSTLAVIDQGKLKILAHQYDTGKFLDEAMALTLSDGKSMLDVDGMIAALSDGSLYAALKG